MKSGTDNFGDPNIPNTLPKPPSPNPTSGTIPNPNEPGYLYPKDAYSDLEQKVADAKAQAQSDCADKEKCCKTITVKVNCLGGKTEFSDYVPKGKPVLCGKTWTLNCKTGKWTP